MFRQRELGKKEIILNMLTRTETAESGVALPNKSYAGASKDAISHHYDNGIAFYKLWLGDDMYYTAAKFVDPLTDKIIHDNYKDAQDAKSKFHLDAVGASKDRSLLDIGCGWGTSLTYASRHERFSNALGLTLSEQQAGFVNSLGLPNALVLAESYEHFEPQDTFDGIITLGALEHFAKPSMKRADKIHVYEGYFSRCAEWLNKGGHLSVQCSTWNGISREFAERIVPSDVFPESDLAYEDEVFEAAAPYFELHHYERSMTDYILTIKYWHDRLKENREEITALIGQEQYDFHDRYMRRVSAGFKRRRIQLSRFVFRKR